MIEPGVLFKVRPVFHRFRSGFPALPVPQAALCPVTDIDRKTVHTICIEREVYYMNRLGTDTFFLLHPPVIVGRANAVGQTEGCGPLSSAFDFIGDDAFQQDTWEKAEREMQKLALSLAAEKAGLALEALDLLFSGDLLNQCVSSSHTARDTQLPHFGLYSACATFGEALMLTAMALEGGFGSYGAAAASSHFCTAERQYRTPLEYGGQRTPTAQWTVTGAGACILASQGVGPQITHITPGRVTDAGVTDANNMGAAMAPVDDKLAPSPEEARQYKIQPFSTKSFIL